MKSSAIIAIVIAIIVILGGWYAYANFYSAPAVTPSTGTTVNTNPNGPDYYPNGNPASTTPATSSTSGVSADINAGVTTGSTAKTVTVTLSANGFSPKSVTIKKGDTVMWKNDTTSKMWIASANHPTHTVYDGSTEQAHCAAGYTGAKPFDECANGSSFSFTFNKVGSWNYHNHSNSTEFGTVVVQ